MSILEKNKLKGKGFYNSVILFFLLGSTLSIFSQKVYVEKDGIVMMEAENTTSPLGKWGVSTHFNNYSGTGYIEYLGGEVTGVGAAESPLIYRFKILQAGDYALQVRGRSRLLKGEERDWANDAWFRVEGDYTVGVNGPKDISWMQNNTKLFVGRGGNGKWGWGTNYDKKHVQPKAIFKFKAGEIYTLIMSGRSKRFNVDRILFFKTTIENHVARANVTESESINDDEITEKYTYLAIKDFANINAGEVHYYKDKVRKALAIKASVVVDRDKFAKAETIFTGKDGAYNITLNTLAEFDGECTYHVFVNKYLVGTYQNSAVNKDNDYKKEQVIFKNIKINQGDAIAVSSNTHTNGLIPEGNGTAWARGRWESLLITTFKNN
ncbi:hypothetical protein [Polaribacter butkevichii]|uniref:Uncharacterized protein n=1 Tax=Polaribacter butkevichii TaxID=218490 RepID=A0A2P6CCI8_9FLAO|nr:hypothetical protein [Polaribacter butkevichii]PQJ72626.1 hypothetical protein BTO14_04870 [Polaribacter butkevichii]